MSDSIIDALLFGQKRAVAKAAGSVSSERLYGEATGINWCEKDYQVTPYICEFWNTCTNIVYVYFGLYCLRETWRLKLPRRFAWFSVFILLTGAFSALFHATLWMLGQKLDEIFENATLISMYHAIATGNTDTSDTFVAAHILCCVLGILFVAGFLFCEVHLICMAIFSGRALCSQAHLEDQNIEPKNLMYSLSLRAKRAVSVTAIGGVCWLLDRVACTYLQRIKIPIFGMPQLHAWWHVFTGVALYECFVLTAALHLVRQRKSIQSGRQGKATLPLAPLRSMWFSLSQLETGRVGVKTS